MGDGLHKGGFERAYIPIDFRLDYFSVISKLIAQPSLLRHIYNCREIKHPAFSKQLSRIKLIFTRASKVHLYVTFPKL